MCSMLFSWENLIVSMSTSSPAGTLKFDDGRNNLMNEEIQRKLVTTNQGGEVFTITDRGRKIDQTRKGCPKSRGRSKSRRGRIT